MLVIVPSRGRPDNVRRLISTLQDTRAVHTELLVIVDEDDPKFDEYADIFKHEQTPRWARWGVGPRLGMNATLNETAVRNVYDYDIIGFMGDDHIPRTPGWDMHVAQAINEGVPMFYGNDLLQGPNLPTAIFMNSKVIEALGFMAPPVLQHLYLDNFWLALGREIGIRYRDDIIFEHSHPVAGKTEWDDTYREANSGSVWSHDAEAYAAYMENSFATDVAKVRALL